MEECVLIDQTALNEIVIPKKFIKWGVAAWAVNENRVNLWQKGVAICS